LGTKYLIVLCAGSTLPLAKQSSDEAPYKLSKVVAKLAGITFSRIHPPPGRLNLGFITEVKLAAIFIKTFSWGFPTGRLFTTHSHVNLVVEISVAVAVYLRRSFHTIITAPSVAAGAKLRPR
jgi:hypothetical protein